MVLLFLNIFFKVPVTAVTTSNHNQNFGCMNIDSNMTNFIEEADKSGQQKLTQPKVIETGIILSIADINKYLL